MILPIYVYGNPVLKKQGDEIDKNYPNLKELIDNMFETMYAASGVGLAASQVGIPISLFVMDPSVYAEDFPETEGFKKVFINPEITETSGNISEYNEGCLSFPHLRENILRASKIRIKYFDENFVVHDETYEGIIARVIQHEYDHTGGVIFVDRMNSLKKLLNKRKLTDISKGKFEIPYKTKISGKK